MLKGFTRSHIHVRRGESEWLEDLSMNMLIKLTKTAVKR